MPMPTYFGSGAFGTSTGTLIPVYPASTLADDIAILVVESENEAISLSDAQGFVEVTNSPQFAGTAGVDPANRIAVYWKRLLSPPGVGPTIADAGNHVTGQLHVFRGVKTTGNPWNITAGANDAVEDEFGDVPGATTTVADCLVVLICGSSDNFTRTTEFSDWTNADLATLTERTDNTNTVGVGGGHGMATGEKATPGAYGTTTVTLASASYKGLMSIALEGAAAADIPPGLGPIVHMRQSFHHDAALLRF